ncbi:MAG: acetyl-CoA acetyltransferase [Ilumatobacteraceae bacterium]
MIDPRTPVLVGVGQFLHHAAGLDDALEPVALMEAAISAAATDAGLDGPPAFDSIRVVSSLSWKYGNPGWVIAERLGQAPRQLAYTTSGGNTPQTLLNTTAGDIVAGRLDVALLTGGEAWRTRTRARREGAILDWAKAPDGVPPVMLGDDFDMTHPVEADRGVYLPVQVYPMFESAIRAAAGRTPDEHLAIISEIWARFSAVATGNPAAWSREPKTAEEIRTTSPQNRLIGLPYRKYMNSNNDVDMAAALIVCSVEAARRLGVAEDRWVFVHSSADCHEHAYASNRDTFARTPAIEMGGRAALEAAGLTIDDISVVDLYSCFPAAVQLGAQSLGLSTDQQLTRTGGLAFAGGPWNNYVMHAIATVVGDLRDRPGEHGLVWANGGYATKHAFGVYGTEPPAAGYRHADPQAAIDALPWRDLAVADDALGPVTIEAYTVMHDRDGTPEQAIATCLLPDGRRAWATSGRPDVLGALLDGEWVGYPATIGAESELHV